MDAQTFVDHVNASRHPPRELCAFVCTGGDVRANRPSQPVILPSGLVQFDCVHLHVNGMQTASTRVVVDPAHVGMLIL